MIQLTAHAIATLLTIPITIEKDLRFIGISLDSRSIVRDNLFVAIRGEQFDGHDFVQEAFQKGAALALVTHRLDCEIPQLIVPDTTLALGKIASYWRTQFNLSVLAVTGSNGKTTVKNMLASILRTHAASDDAVLATSGNLNNHWGLPLTLAQLNSNHRYAVIEMGMNHFGELDYLTHLAEPTIAALITNVGAAHLEGVGGTLEGVAVAKAEIFAGVLPTGTAILNRDDQFYALWQEKTRHLKQLSFGLNPAADVHANIDISNTVQRLLVTTPKGNETIELPLLGEHNAKNALAAIAACTAIDIPLLAMKQGLMRMRPEKSRLCLSVLSSGTKLIDDTYNANPDSFNAAINTLANFKETTVLVMGDMKELGSEAGKWHDFIGKCAKTAGITHLFTFGELSQMASVAFGKHAQHFSDRHALCDAVKKYCTDNTTILIKGSRSMQMEKVVHYLVEEVGSCDHNSPASVK